MRVTGPAGRRGVGPAGRKRARGRTMRGTLSRCVLLIVSAGGTALVCDSLDVLCSGMRDVRVCSAHPRSVGTVILLLFSCASHSLCFCVLANVFMMLE